MSRRSLSVSIAIVLLFGSLALLTQPEKGDVLAEEEDARGPDDGIFQSTRIYQETDLVYRSAYGDLIPSRVGNELATCSRNGKVVVSYGSRNSWTSEVAHVSYHNKATGETAEVYSLMAGDVLPERPGDELIAVDAQYRVNLVTHDEENGWKTEFLWEIWNEPDWIYEVDIGELVQNGDQQEIVIVGEFRKAYLLTRQGSVWTNQSIIEDVFMLETCHITDILPEYQGNEVIAAGLRGAVLAAYHDGTSWKQKEIFDLGVQVTDLLTADIDPRYPGPEIYASTKLGDVRCIYLENGKWHNRTVYSEGRLIYGMETGRIDGQNVLSIATYGSRIVLLWLDTSWQSRPIYAEEYYIMGTGIYDIDPNHNGDEILALSYLGRVTMIYRDEPGVSMILPFNKTEAAPGELLKVPLLIEGKGGYEGLVDLVAASPDADVRLSDRRIGVNNITILEVEMHGSALDVQITVTASTIYGSETESLLIVPGEQSFVTSLDPPLIETEVGADRQISERIVISTGVEPGRVLTISNELVPRGINAESSLGSVTPESGKTPVDIVLSGESWVRPGLYCFFVILNDGSGVVRALGIELKVNERSVSDFKLIPKDAYIELPIGSNTTTSVNIISINGFLGNVNITIPQTTEDLEISLSTDSIVPTGTVDINISALKGEGYYLITIRGVDGKLTRETYISLLLVPPEAELIVSIKDQPVVFNRTEDGNVRAEILVRLTPKSGVIRDIIISVEGLGNNFSISASPDTIERLSYSINLTLIIHGPEEELPGSLVLNFTAGEPPGYWTAEARIEINEPSDGGPGNGGTIALILILAAIVAVILASGIILLARSNVLNRGEGVIPVHGEDRTISRRNASPERIHGGSGRMGGFDR
ncbi:MAG: hypothetical protein ACMUIE_04945 [Thermoplasmatota archaeon]